MDATHLLKALIGEMAGCINYRFFEKFPVQGLFLYLEMNGWNPCYSEGNPRGDFYMKGTELIHLSPRSENSSHLIARAMLHLADLEHRRWPEILVDIMRLEHIPYPSQFAKWFEANGWEKHDGNIPKWVKGNNEIHLPPNVQIADYATEWAYPIIKFLMILTGDDNIAHEIMSMGAEKE